MKNLFTLLLPALLLISLMACTPKKRPEKEERYAVEKLSPQKDGEYDVYLLIGQSNMAGRGYMVLPADTNYIMQNVWLLNGDDIPEPAKNPMNRYSTVRKPMDQQRISPATTFGESVAARTGRRILIVMNALGGSSIEQWSKDAPVISDRNSIGRDTLQLYAEAIRRAKIAQQYGTLRGILWHHGEANSSASKVVHYPYQLAQLAENLRTDLDAPDVPFIAGELAYWRNEGKGSVAFNEMIRQIRTFVPNSDWISAEGTDPMKDESDYHFGREGQLLLGRRYAEKILSLVYGITG
ncbi:MAG: sialate O-acetylesterase [Bacteroides sp.]|nr:sialate O-acetylesterase [Bacteroides sp.]